MAHWIFKQEPDSYSFADLEKDGETVWDGITNPLAQKHLRSVTPADKVLLYHTGKEKAVVGEMAILAEPVADPSDDKGKRVTVKVKAKKGLAKPVSLEMLKAEKLFEESPIVKMPRLSVVPLTEQQWAKIFELAGETVESPKPRSMGKRK